MPLFFIHASLMAAGFLFVFSALIVAMTQRRKRWWLRIHRAIGLTGGSLLLLGAVAAVGAVASMPGGHHLRTPHTWLGAVTIMTALVVPVLGLLQFRLRAKAGTLRTFHRYCGRFLVGAALVAILLGLRLTGIL
jgi:hypothetical protein